MKTNNAKRIKELTNQVEYSDHLIRQQAETIKDQGRIIDGAQKLVPILTRNNEALSNAVNFITKK